MIHNLKALGLMVVAALAVCAMLASAAEANQGFTSTFTCGKTFPLFHTTCLLHGEQVGTPEDNYFETSGGSKVQCENAGVTYTGHMADGTASEITVTPHYSDCTMEELPAVVTMNGCTFTLTRPTKTPTDYHGTVDLVCPAGQVVVIHRYLFGTSTGSHMFDACTITILPKVGLTEVTYTTGVKNAKDDIKIDVNINNLIWTKEGGCGHSEGTAGKFVSTVTVTAKNVAGEPDDLWLSGE
jgi:hypothetical protein